jgi:probable HAF family extracellular repeat protein
MKNIAINCVAIISSLLATLLVASAGHAQVMYKSPLRHQASSSRQLANHKASQVHGSGSPSYSYTLLNYPGTLSTLAEGINLGATSAKVEVVGGINLNNDAVDGEGETEGGFIAHLSGTKTFTETYQALNDPHIPVYQGALAINDSGDIVGTYLDASGDFHAYEKVGSKFTNLDVPFSGASNTTAYGINNSGEVVGAYEDASGLSHAFTLVSGTYTSFDYPGATQTLATGINSVGEIVGEYGNDSGWHGFSLSGTTFTSFDYPGGSTETGPIGINDSGAIVGFYCVTEECIGDISGAQGFLLTGDTFTNIGIPGEYFTEATGINNNGMIVGFYQDAAGVINSFIATP